MDVNAAEQGVNLVIVIISDLAAAFLSTRPLNPGLAMSIIFRLRN